MAQPVESPPAIQETQEMWVWSLGWEDALEEKVATHSGILAWRIPWTEKPGSLHPCGHKELDMTEQLSSISPLVPNSPCSGGLLITRFPESTSKTPGFLCLHKLHFLTSCQVTLMLPMLLLLSHFSRVRPSATQWPQPSRLLRPWDFPGNSTGVGCHCLLRMLPLQNQNSPSQDSTICEPWSSRCSSWF